MSAMQGREKAIYILAIYILSFFPSPTMPTHENTEENGKAAENKKGANSLCRLQITYPDFKTSQYHTIEYMQGYQDRSTCRDAVRGISVQCYCEVLQLARRRIKKVAHYAITTEHRTASI